MSDAVINGVFSLGGVVIGSLLSLFGVIITNSFSKRKQYVQDICDQVAAYWILEEEMAQHIFVLEENSRAVKTIKEDFRSKVFNSKGIRPTMTEADAIRFKKRI